MGVYGELFVRFFRIGALTFGGGYTILPLMQREIVGKKGWASHEEVMDYYAVAQCLPGMIAVNTAILIGYRVKGKPGAAVAAAGLVMPSLLIILLIASLIQNFAGLAVVRSAFAGIRVAVCALVVNAVYTMAKKGIVSIPTACISVLTFAGAAWLEASPVLLVALAAAAGLILSRRKGRLKSAAETAAETAAESAAASAGPGTSAGQSVDKTAGPERSTGAAAGPEAPETASPERKGGEGR